MTQLPAPYESAQQDDLAATLAATMTATAALITAWVLGAQAYPVIEQGIRLVVDDASNADQDAFGDWFSGVVGVPTIGWSIATVFLVIGALLVLFRRGRGTVVIGALIGVATTAFAQFAVGYGPADNAETTYPVEQWPLFWGGIVVIVLAALPATGRWVGRTRRSSPHSTVVGTTSTGAILWPGM